METRVDTAERPSALLAEAEQLLSNEESQGLRVSVILSGNRACEAQQIWKMDNNLRPKIAVNNLTVGQRIRHLPNLAVRTFDMAIVP